MGDSSSSSSFPSSSSSSSSSSPLVIVVVLVVLVLVLVLLVLLVLVVVVVVVVVLLLLLPLALTARCGLWPVAQYRSIFSYLSPPLSIFSLLASEDLSLRPLSILSCVVSFVSPLPVLQ